MRYNRNSKSHHENSANRKNTPHLIENTAVIILSYVFSGVNLIYAGFHSIETIDGSLPKYLIFVGVVMLLMVPISVLDNRREMRGKLAAILGCSMNLAICFMLSFFSSFWWMAVYVCEVLVCFFASIIARKLFR